jgi:hypothetical protein
MYGSGPIPPRGSEPSALLSPRRQGVSVRGLNVDVVELLHDGEPAIGRRQAKRAAPRIGGGPLRKNLISVAWRVRPFMTSHTRAAGTRTRVTTRHGTIATGLPAASFPGMGGCSMATKSRMNVSLLCQMLAKSASWPSA